MGKNKTYDEEYKIQAVKLGLEIGAAKAARELGISSNTLMLVRKHVGKVKGRTSLWSLSY